MMRTILLLALVAFCSCSTMKHSPTNEYRESKPYHYSVQKIKKIELDSIRVSSLPVAAAILHYNKVQKKIDLDFPEISDQITQSLQRYFDSLVVNSDSLVFYVHEGKHAIDNDLSKKINLFSYLQDEESNYNDILTHINSDKNQTTVLSDSFYSFHPYIELTVRKGLEYDGGGGISMAYPTGNMKYWITYGMIIEMQKDGRKFYSRGYYYTEFKKVPEETEMAFTFPSERIDSLVSLCLKDFPLKEEQ